MRQRLATVLAITGGGLLVGGVAAIYWPAALICAGAVLLYMGLFAVDVGDT